MDNFENTGYQPESQPQQTPPAGNEFPSMEEYNTYRGAGVGRKESPFANSPYEMPHQNRSEYTGYTPGYVPQEPPKKPKAKKKGGFWKGFLSLILVAALVAGGCFTTAEIVNDRWEAQNYRSTQQMNQQIADLQSQIDALSKNSGASVSGTATLGDGLTPGQVYAQNVDSVVAISSTVQASSYYGTSQGTSTGSGFIISEDGYVITNQHVVEGATAVTVVTHDGTEYEATIVGTDSNNDVAVLKVEATGLPAAVIGSSDDLIIGDMVVAIGNPLGTLTATQTVGYVSGKDRDISTDNSIINMIQTDAAINSGNSGGPLFNMRGEVVGITTAKYSGTSGSGASIEGIGFAIPIDDVKGIISDLMDYGYVTGAYLGVTVRNMDSEAASMYGLPMGAYVETVERGSAAHMAGVQSKDIIVELGGYEVEGVTSLSRALRHFKAGDTTTITVNRGGQLVVLDITLDEKPQATAAATSPSAGTDMPNGDYNEWYDWFFGRKDG